MAGNSQRPSPIQPALRHARTSQVAMANSRPFVEADPAMMKLQFISPPKKPAPPTNAPRMSPSATASSPKIMIFENHVWASALTKNSIKERYQSKAIAGFGVIFRPLFQYSSRASPVPIHLGSTNLCQPPSRQAQPK